jgi:hypothetical protein
VKAFCVVASCGDVVRLCVGSCMTSNGGVAAADHVSVLPSMLLSTVCVAGKEDDMCHQRGRAFVAEPCVGLSMGVNVVVVDCVSVLPRHLVLDGVRNRTLTLIEREDDTRSWRNFLVYFSHSTTMLCPPRGWGYILIAC